MGEVLSFREEHADDVARAFFRSVRGSNREPGKSLPQYFTSLHLNNPWASSDIPALVYVEKGKVAGALGVLPRTMEFQGRRLRMATMTIYFVDPDYRNGPAGIQLLRHALKGPQDLSWTDGASGSVHALWSAMGGAPAPLYSFNWIRVLRPVGLACSVLGGAGTARRILKDTTSLLLAAPSDWLLSRTPVSALRRPVTPYTAKLVNAGELLACIHEIGWKESLKPLYGADDFSWLIGEAAKNLWGELRTMTVSNPEGELRGWFVYYGTPGGSSLVLQIGVRGKEDFRDTLSALFRDAWDIGSVCVKGASIPQYLTAMTELHCLFRHPYDRVVAHSKDPAIANAIKTGEAAISRLDGNGWLRFSRDPWDR